MNTYDKYNIIDAHSHIFPEKIVEGATKSIGKFYDLKMRNVGTSEKLIESGSKIGVSKYLVCSVATVPKQVGSINNFIAEECKKHPEFVGLGAMHPNSETLEEDFNQILELGLKGIKIHPDFQQFSMDSLEAYGIYELAEGKLPVLIHFGDSRFERSAPKKMLHIHRDFPNLTVIAPHLGGYERWDEAKECLSGMENVWFDTCSAMAFMSPERAREQIEAFGIDRCMFGTDFPMWHHTAEFENLMKLGFTEEENRKILSENFCRLFNL